MLAQLAPTQYVTVHDTKIAFRRFGKSGAVPLLFLTHLRGTMDLVDPLLANTIARNRELILYDDAGCGHSEGTTPDTIHESGSLIVDFLEAVQVPEVDIVGFSLGGMIAQSIAVNFPGVIRRLVLAGTQSSHTDGMAFSGPEVAEIAGGAIPSAEDMLKLFFTASKKSRALGSAWLERVKERQVEGEERTTFVDQATGAVQMAAIGAFVSDSSFFNKLKQVEIPILVTNGQNDIMTPTPNSFIMQQQLRNAEMHLYPDAGHGHLYQVPELFVAHLELFLS